MPYCSISYSDPNKPDKPNKLSQEPSAVGVVIQGVGMLVVWTVLIVIGTAITLAVMIPACALLACGWEGVIAAGGGSLMLLLTVFLLASDLK